MRMHCQRWVYRIRNSVVCIDNGFAWIGWAQERMVVNDEPVQISGGWFRMRQDFLEPWIGPGGEGTLAVRMVAGIMTVHCSADLDGELLEPSETLKADWSGPKMTWPGATSWIPAKF